VIALAQIGSERLPDFPNVPAVKGVIARGQVSRE